MLAEELLDIVEEYPPEEREMRLRTLLASYLPPKPEPIKIASEPPTVYYFFGVNGVGKTTTIAKFAHILKKRGKVMVIGADTFRAAATDQLGLWAEKVGVDAHLGERGADPSSVIYTGVEKAKARGYDFVLVDTAGRMSTKKNLIEELKKMERVVKKVVPDAPHESFLVLDATQGQAAFRQAKTFMEAVQVTRIILTKLDSTAKGGFIFSIWKELGLPIAFLSFGQELEDWVEYSPSVILDNLFGESR
jgi:fused signal recognition particle receptor